MVDNEHEELDELRAEIDKVDLRLLDDLSEFIRDRMRIVEKIGAYKRKAGLKIPDSKREENVLRDRADRGRSRGLSGEMVRKIWEAIIRFSKERE